jgi:hypothetical protein
MKNQTQKARHSVENEGPMKHAKPIASRSIMGTTRIYPDPFLDGEPGDLRKGRMTAEVASHILGYRTGDAEVTNKYGADNRGNMPQLGERTKASKRTTSIKHRSLK